MRRIVPLLTMSFVFLAIFSFPVMGQEREPVELKPALLVIDIQNSWLPHMAEEDRDGALKNINEVIGLFRDYGRPIVRVYHTDSERGPKPGTELFEFPGTVDISDDDPMIIKNYPSSFTKTDLEKVLRESECNALFLCGLSATGCVLATYYGALDREFVTVMVEGALLSPNASYTRVIEDICTSMTLEEVEETLKDASKH